MTSIWETVRVDDIEVPARNLSYLPEADPVVLASKHWPTPGRFEFSIKLTATIDEVERAGLAMTERFAEGIAKGIEANKQSAVDFLLSLQPSPAVKPRG